MSKTLTLEEEEQQWWQEDAARHNAMCEQAQKLGIVASGRPSILPQLEEDGSLADVKVDNAVDLTVDWSEGLDWELIDGDGSVDNAFCPTGQGGGIKNDCGSLQERHSALSSAKAEADALVPGSSHEHISKKVSQALAGVSHDDAKSLFRKLVEGHEAEYGNPYPENAFKHNTRTKKAAVEAIHRRVLLTKIARDAVMY